MVKWKKIYSLVFPAMAGSYLWSYSGFVVWLRITEGCVVGVCFHVCIECASVVSNASVCFVCSSVPDLCIECYVTDVYAQSQFCNADILRFKKRKQKRSVKSYCQTLDSRWICCWEIILALIWSFTYSLALVRISFVRLLNVNKMENWEVLCWQY